MLSKYQVVKWQDDSKDGRDWCVINDSGFIIANLFEKAADNLARELNKLVEKVNAAAKFFEGAF